MKSIDELYKELNSLPNGYISKKTIKGHNYFYLQYFESGYLKSKYISKSQVELYKSQIARRKIIEKQIHQLERSGQNLITLSTNHRKLSGHLMSGDTIVASFNEGVLTYIDTDKAPFIIKRSQSLQRFLSKRIFDDSRVNTRLLKKVMSIKEKDPIYISLLVHGAVISDDYWFKARGSRTKYKDIIFSDIYADVSLKGIIYPYLKKNKLSPDLTLNGSYEKCWKRINDSWWLFKKENELERFSEIFSSELAKQLGIPTVKHFLDGDFIKCENFAKYYNFEPISSLCDEDDSYNHVFNTLFDLDKSLAFDYLKLMMFDVIVNNVDRHNENYGFLRDKQTGKVVSLAPNFDNNLSLLAVDPLLSSKDGFISIFKKFLKENSNAYELFKEIHIGLLDESTIRGIIKNIPIKIDNEDALVSYILNRYYKVINL